MNEGFAVENVKKQDDSFILGKVGETRHRLSLKETVKQSDGVATKTVPDENSTLKSLKVHVSISSDSPLEKAPVGKQRQELRINENYILFQSDDDSALSSNDAAKPVMRCDMPPKSVTLIDQMNRLLVRHRKSSRAMKPRWSSVRGREIVAAKLQILNARSVEKDPELYTPLFRNASMFKRSYELMERTLRVYVYEDGEKPIFHHPILKGLYA